MTDGWQDEDTALFVLYGDAFVPRRSEQFDVICDLLRELPLSEVLELGCGDGGLTERILGASHRVRVTAVDSSASMLRLARSRLASFADRVEFCGGVVEDTGVMEAGRFGAVISSLVVHHLDDVEKRRLYQSVFTALVPGGVLLLADLIRPAGAATLSLAADRWDTEVCAANPAAVGPFETSRWNTFRFPDPVDRPSRVGEHLRGLAEAGFADADVCWLYAGHAVLYARRPDPAEESA